MGAGSSVTTPPLPNPNPSAASSEHLGFVMKSHFSSLCSPVQGSRRFKFKDQEARDNMGQTGHNEQTAVVHVFFRMGGRKDTNLGAGEGKKNAILGAVRGNGGSRGVVAEFRQT